MDVKKGYTIEDLLKEAGVDSKKSNSIKNMLNPVNQYDQMTIDNIAHEVEPKIRDYTRDLEKIDLPTVTHEDYEPDDGSFDFYDSDYGDESDTIMSDNSTRKMSDSDVYQLLGITSDQTYKQVQQSQESIPQKQNNNQLDIIKENEDALVISDQFNKKLEEIDNYNFNEDVIDYSELNKKNGDDDMSDKKYQKKDVVSALFNGETLNVYSCKCGRTTSSKESTLSCVECDTDVELRPLDNDLIIDLERKIFESRISKNYSEDSSEYKSGLEQLNLIESKMKEPFNKSDTLMLTFYNKWYQKIGEHMDDDKREQNVIEEVVGEETDYSVNEEDLKNNNDEVVGEEKMESEDVVSKTDDDSTEEIGEDEIDENEEASEEMDETRKEEEQISEEHVEDEPVEDVVEDEPVEDVVEDEPVEDVVEDEPVEDVVEDEPVEDVVEDEPVEDETESEIKSHVYSIDLLNDTNDSDNNETSESKLNSVESDDTNTQQDITVRVDGLIEKNKNPFVVKNFRNNTMFQTLEGDERTLIELWFSNIKSNMIEFNVEDGKDIKDSIVESLVCSFCGSPIEPRTLLSVYNGDVIPNMDASDMELIKSVDRSGRQNDQIYLNCDSCLLDMLDVKDKQDSGVKHKTGAFYTSIALPFLNMVNLKLDENSDNIDDVLYPADEMIVKRDDGCVFKISAFDLIKEIREQVIDEKYTIDEESYMVYDDIVECVKEFNINNKLNLESYSYNEPMLEKESINIEGIEDLQKCADEFNKLDSRTKAKMKGLYDNLDDNTKKSIDEAVDKIKDDLGLEDKIVGDKKEDAQFSDTMSVFEQIEEFIDSVEEIKESLIYSTYSKIALGFEVGKDKIKMFLQKRPITEESFQTYVMKITEEELDFKTRVFLAIKLYIYDEVNKSLISKKIKQSNITHKDEDDVNEDFDSYIDYSDRQNPKYEKVREENSDIDNMKVQNEKDSKIKEEGSINPSLLYQPEHLNSRNPFEDGKTFYKLFQESSMWNIVQLIRNDELHKTSGKLLIGKNTAYIPMMDFESGIRVVYIDLEDTILNPGMLNIGYLAYFYTEFTYESHKNDFDVYFVYSSDARVKGEQIAACLVKAINFGVLPDHKYVFASGGDAVTKKEYNNQIDDELILIYTTSTRDIKKFNDLYSPLAYPKPKTNSLGVIVLYDEKKLGSTAESLKNEVYRKYISGTSDDFELMNHTPQMICSINYVADKVPDMNDATRIEKIKYFVTQYIEHPRCVIMDAFEIAMGSLIKEHIRNYGALGYEIYIEFEQTIITSPSFKQYFINPNEILMINDTSLDVTFSTTTEAYAVVNPLHVAMNKGEKYAARVDKRILIDSEIAHKAFFSDIQSSAVPTKTIEQRLAFLEERGYVMYYEPEIVEFFIPENILCELENLDFMRYLKWIDLDALRSHNTNAIYDLNSRISFMKYLKENKNQPIFDENGELSFSSILKNVGNFITSRIYN